MATADGGVRISIEVSKEVHDKLTAFLPWGTKAEVVRSLIDVLISAQENENRYIADDLIKGRCKLISVEL